MFVWREVCYSLMIVYMYLICYSCDLFIKTVQMSNGKLNESQSFMWIFSVLYEANDAMDREWCKQWFCRLKCLYNILKYWSQKVCECHSIYQYNLIINAKNVRVICQFRKSFMHCCSMVHFHTFKNCVACINNSYLSVRFS